MTTTLCSTLEPISHDRRLDGSVALVAGGGRGIGRFVARALGEAGASVALIARSRDQMDETADIIRSTGGTAAVAVADVADADAMKAAVTQLQCQLGPVDLLVNNAGIVGPIGPLWEVDRDEWWAAIDVNLRGIVLASQLVLPRMVARRRGRIINITSRAGSHRGPLLSAYSVSKAAVTKLTENLAHETARFGVNVFSLDDGGGAEPGAAIELITRVARGDADSLSGRHISVHDNLAAPSRRASHGWAMSVIGGARGSRS